MINVSAELAWGENGDAAETREISGVKRQQVRHLVPQHCSHQARIVRVLAGDPVTIDQPAPKVENGAFISKQKKQFGEPFDVVTRLCRRDT